MTTTITSEMDALCHGLGDQHGFEMFRSVLDRVGDKWSLLVIGLLQPGPQRFTELLRAVPGISRRMLTLTLRQLERDGLVDRAAYAEIPPRVEYRVTALGQTLTEPVLVLARWASANQTEIAANLDAYDDRLDGALVS